MTNDELARAIEEGCTQLEALLREAVRRMDGTGVLALDSGVLYRTDLQEITMGLYAIADGSADAYEQEEAVRFVEQTLAPAPEPEPRHKTNAAYVFWRTYQRAFQLHGHTQKILAATCKAHGIDQTDTSPATLARVRDILASQ